MSDDQPTDERPKLAKDPTSPAYYQARGASVNDSLVEASQAAARRYRKPGGYRLAMDGRFHPWRESDRLDSDRLARNRESRASRPRRREGTKMVEEKWSGNVRVERGELERYGWRADAPADTRHTAIERSVEAVGYAKTIRRLGFVANVSSPEHDRLAKERAREDERWAREWEAGDRDEDDRRREHGTEHGVKGYTKDDGERVRPHLAKNPRRS